jgi:vacuolar iron transporter family protein
VEGLKYFKKYIPEFVYGATDGTVTTFAIIAGVMGAALSPMIVIVLGVANLLADGFSMAASNYLSVKSSASINDETEKRVPIKTATITFFSFIIVGSIPLIPFLANAIIPAIDINQFAWSIIFTAAAFTVIGAARGIVMKKHKLVASLETLLIGGIVAVIAFGAGFILRGFVGV